MRGAGFALGQSLALTEAPVTPAEYDHPRALEAAHWWRVAKGPQGIALGIVFPPGPPVIRLAPARDVGKQRLAPAVHQVQPPGKRPVAGQEQNYVLATYATVCAATRAHNLGGRSGRASIC